MHKIKKLLKTPFAWFVAALIIGAIVYGGDRYLNSSTHVSARASIQFDTSTQNVEYLSNRFLLKVKSGASKSQIQAELVRLKNYSKAQMQVLDQASADPDSLQGDTVSPEEQGAYDVMSGLQFNLGKEFKLTTTTKQQVAAQGIGQSGEASDMQIEDYKYVQLYLEAGVTPDDIKNLNVFFQNNSEIIYGAEPVPVAKVAAYGTTWSVVNNKAYPTEFDNPNAPLTGQHWYLEQINAPKFWYDARCYLNNCAGTTNTVIAVIDTGITTEGTSASPATATFTYTNTCVDKNNDNTYTKDECLLPVTKTGDLTFTVNASRFTGLNSSFLYHYIYSLNTPQCNDNYGVDMEIYLYNKAKGLLSDPCSSNNRAKEGKAYDDYGHGTAIADSIINIAGDGNPGIGIYDMFKVFPIKANIPFTGKIAVDTLAASIEYAADLPYVAVIVVAAGTPADSAVLRDAVAYAQQKGVAIVAAAGNDGVNQLLYPAAYAAEFDNVIAVGAVDNGLTKANFSNYGYPLTVVGAVSDAGIPINTLSCVSTSCDPTNTSGSNYTWNNGTSYAITNLKGTSIATAQVATAVALLEERYSSLAPHDLKGLLMASARDITGKPGTAPGYDEYTGAGIIDLGKMYSLSPKVEWGRLPIDGSSAVYTVNFTKNFTIPPVVLASVNTSHGPDMNYVKIVEVTSTYVKFKLAEPPKHDGSHTFEEISWIAFEMSDVFNSTYYEVGRIYVTDKAKTIYLERDYSNSDVLFFSQIQAQRGVDYAKSQLLNYDGKTVKLAVLEDKYVNDLTHTYEPVGWVIVKSNFAADNNGQIIKTTVNHNTKDISFNKTYSNVPFVLAGHQTRNGADLNIVDMLNVTRSGIRARLQENTKTGFDGKHIDETIGFLVLPDSKPPATDTLLLTTTLTHQPKTIMFNRLFGGMPIVLASMQTTNGLQPAQVRILNKTRFSVTLRLLEDKRTGLDGSHIAETVKILVVRDDTNMQYVEANHNWQTLGTFTYDAQAGTGFLPLAQQQTLRGLDPVITDFNWLPNNTLKMRLEENPKAYDGTHTLETVGVLKGQIAVIKEHGLVTTDHNWTTVQLTGTYTQPPAIFTAVVSENGTDPVSVRIKDVTTSNFKIRLQEPNNYDGNHVPEKVFWVAVE